MTLRQTGHLASLTSNWALQLGQAFAFLDTGMLHHGHSNERPLPFSIIFFNFLFRERLFAPEYPRITSNPIRMNTGKDPKIINGFILLLCKTGEGHFYSKHWYQIHAKTTVNTALCEQAMIQEDVRFRLKRLFGRVCNITMQDLYQVFSLPAAWKKILTIQWTSLTTLLLF